MRRLVGLGVVLASVGCLSVDSPRQTGGDKRANASARAAPAEVNGHFFARTTEGTQRELELRSLTVDVTVGQGMVRSHLSMEVAAKDSLRQAEAVIRLRVPPGAAVTDAFLWMEDQRRMRGAFVERGRARAIYASIVNRRRDPALVTWDGPGWVAVTIFPLEGEQARRFELDWVEPAAVAGGQIQYRVPIVADGARVVGRAALVVDGRPLANREDLVAIGPADSRQTFSCRGPGDPFRQVLAFDRQPSGAPHFVLVAETSAAMSGAERRRQRAVLGRLFAALPPDARVTILAADWSVSPIVEEASTDGLSRALAKLDAIPSAGALHLERALREGAARARQTGAHAVLFVGRGDDAFRGDAVASARADLEDAEVRLSFVDVGVGDPPLPMNDVVVETGGESVVTVPDDESLERLVEALRPRSERRGGDPRAAGDWHALRTVLGDLVWVGRALDGDSGRDDDSGGAGGSGTANSRAAHTDADGSPEQAADLASLWARAYLEWHDRDPREEVVPVLTPVTSILVLERNADYQRFGLDVPEPPAGGTDGPGKRHRAEEGKMGKGVRPGERGALYGIAGPAGREPERLAEEQTRNAGILGLLQPSASPGVDSAAGWGAEIGEEVRGGLVGTLSTIGKGSGGRAVGERTIGLDRFGPGAAGLGGRPAVAPDVVPGQATVRGALDREIIRRIVRRHLGDVKACHEQGLVRRPGLEGRILVQFTIAASGHVSTSALQASTVGDRRVESCVVQAFRRWEFPRPLDGDRVVVSYPVVLVPPGGGLDESERTAGAAPAGPAPAATVRPIETALATLAQGSDPARIERIAMLLRLRRIADPEVLAWTIDRRQDWLESHLLVARLLEVKKRHRDAIRVLTEAAAAAPVAIAAELRTMNAPEDATEVRRLASR